MQNPCTRATESRFVVVSHLGRGRDRRDPVLVGDQLAAVLKLVSHIEERNRYRWIGYFLGLREV